ncbi:serine/threonine protein kinase [Actinoplanes sp. NPDC049548]|uniref:serine/threonine protein kinase n=1 Tax=Actinoplanes sp. NPDC049548 TaxID=3155152 RepID=UPI0034417CC9
MQPLLPGDPARVGRYELEGRLGVGGMGTVYLGRSPGGRPAAVKVISPYLLAHPDTLVRFRRETETLRAVRSAGTATLIDCELSAPPYWMATEFIPGPTLADVLDTGGALPVDECLWLMASLAEGLSDIHAYGICHRDLKPDNVIMSATGPRLIDFGLARGPDETGLTRTDIVVGTPGYIAPELMTSADELTPAADVFALGATVAHAATGRRPYGAGRAESICYRILQEDIDLAGVDPELAALIRSCVARDAARRPRPEEIIERCRRGRPAAPVPVAWRETTPSPVPFSWSGASLPPESPVRSDLVGTPSESGPATPAPRRRLPLVLGAVAAAVALVAGGAFAVRQLRPAEDRPAATPAAQATPWTSAPAPATPSVAATTSTPRPSRSPSKKPPPPPSPTRTPRPSTAPPVTTVTSADGRCIQMPPTDSNGAKVQAARCTGSPAQRWRFTREGALMPAAPTATRCLDIGGNAGVDIDYRIQLWDCNLGVAQLWVPQSDGSLFNARSGRCLSILPDADGGPALGIRTCTGAPAQRWKLPRP